MNVSVMLHHHLEYNHYPSIRTAENIVLAQWAIDKAVNAAVMISYSEWEYDDEIISDKYPGSDLEVLEVIEDMHLEFFVAEKLMNGHRLHSLSG